jgi:hypothetical protein
MRERLGLKFFKELEKKTYRLLIERKIIKAKWMLADATVFPEEIKYPNDGDCSMMCRNGWWETSKESGKPLARIRFALKFLSEV